MPISIRHQSRMFCVQCLYEWDFKKAEADIDLIIDKTLQGITDQIDKEFSETIIRGVVENTKQIDDIISATAPEWPIDQIAVIDKTVLRIGIWELMIARDVPPKAVINEAVELGKEFGSESSGKFINGVLGTIYRSADFYIEEAEEFSAGGVVYKKSESGEISFVLVHTRHNRWTIPKGKVELGETWQETATRQIHEETGVENMEITDYLGEIKYSAKREVVDEADESATKQIPVKKIVYIYLIKTNDQKLKAPAAPERGIKDVQWFSSKEALEKIGYENIKEKVKLAIEKIKVGESSDGF